MKKFVITLSIVIFTLGISIAQTQVGTGIGNKAPELTGKSPEGKTINLSDSKGKLVLLDFWASWCKPCRMENPAVVSAYNKYKDKKFVNAKGFTVFSVSLDKTEAAWKQGIAQDKLAWPYHISDLQWWNSKHAAIYGVRSIPANYLLDGKGVILATGLRGPALEAAIEKYLK